MRYIFSILGFGILFYLAIKSPDAEKEVKNSSVIRSSLYTPPLNVSIVYKDSFETVSAYSPPTSTKSAKSVPGRKSVKKTRKPVVYFTPLNIPVTESPGVHVKSLTVEELRDYLSERKFQKLEGKTLLELRRIWLAYAYDQFYWDIHDKTGLPVSVIYAYFIMEATYNGVESSLMVKYKNPGGIKYKGIGRKAKAYDDCYDSKGRKVKCDFAVFETYTDMVSGWSSIFNLPRYSSCKSEKTAPDICECLYRSGYHTGNNWANRAGISRGYWEVRKSFPKR